MLEWIFFFNEFSPELIKNPVQQALLTKLCEHLSAAHVAPDNRTTVSQLPQMCCVPSKACRLLGKRWDLWVQYSGAFLAAISCQLPLNGLQMAREKILGSIRGPGPSALWGRISRGWSSCFQGTWLWPPSSYTWVLWVQGLGKKRQAFIFRWHLSFKMLPFERRLALVVCLHL